MAPRLKCVLCWSLLSTLSTCGDAFSLVQNAAASKQTREPAAAPAEDGRGSSGPFGGARNAGLQRRRHRGGQDDFALRMSQQLEQQSAEESAEDSTEQSTHRQTEALQERRQFLQGLAAFALDAPAARAYDRTFPADLTAADGPAKQPAAAAKKPAALEAGEVAAGSVLWGGALWLLAGSRSNPLATPLANALYDAGAEPWLQDRNDGFFADLPPPLYALLAALFLALGYLADTLLTKLAEGDADIALQLAAVALISGAVLEVGRIASNEKQSTRHQFQAATQLRQEFQEFADRRLLVGPDTSFNCHRTDVIAAFRRFNPKYRTPDSDTYPLSDIEIERLIRDWNRSRQINNGEIIIKDMSSAGFFSGFKVNDEADAFAPR